MRRLDRMRTPTCVPITGLCCPVCCSQLHGAYGRRKIEPSGLGEMRGRPTWRLLPMDGSASIRRPHFKRRPAAD